MPISAVDAINPAFQHAKLQLFYPFRFAQWVRLAFVGFLAGELSSGGGNFHFNLPSPHQDRGSEQLLGTSWPPHLAHHAGVLLGLIPFLILAGFVLVVLFLYVSSVMRFILFDSIISRECHVRQGWARRQPHGFRYFVWQLGLMLVTLAASLILIGGPVLYAWAIGLFVHPREHLFLLIVGGLMLFLLLLVIMVVAGIVHVMTKDFVVPQMALEDITATEGWRRLWSLLKAEKGGYAVYILMKIGLAIGAGIVFGIITLIVLLVLLIPIGGAGVAAVLAGKAAGLTWSLSTIALAVTVGCILLAGALFVGAMINVPAIVFFPAYSIYFFASRYSPLAALLWPQSPASAAPFEPPPLPPAPAPLG